MSSADPHDQVFKALADSRRREILDLLKARARTTGELCEHFNHLHLVAGDAIVATAPTYRGEGHAFL